MKSVLTIIFLSFIISLNAQVWIEEGAVWHYDFDSGLDISCYSGYQQLEYTQDTVIDGITCQKIEGISNTWTGDMFNGSSSFVAGYSYVSGDTVFYRDNNEFFVLYNFGAQVGESWVISTTNNNSGFCGDTSTVKVNAVGDIVINSTTYRTITIETLDSSSYFLSGMYVERFGKIGNHTSPQSIFPNINQCDPNFIDEGCTYGFMCFEDDSFPLYSPNGGSCGYTIGLEKKLDNKDIELYPNPVDNQLMIKVGKAVNLQMVSILNTLGQEVSIHSISEQQNEIDVSALEKGVYFLVFETGMTQKFIKK